MDRQKLISLLEQAIEMLKAPEAVAPQEAPPVPAPSVEDLLKSDEWPEAVPSFLICEDSESDKTERAEGILDCIGFKIQGKKFLDFGCGEGHVVQLASSTASKSVGYDIVNVGQLSWEDDSKHLLTKDFSKVIENGPYDFICLYDVLDHVQNPVELLSQIKLVCSPDTKVFLRFHPWIGRHASHLYKQINKAWVHIFFSEEEIKEMGYKMDFVNKTYFPIMTQKKWLEESGFTIIHEDVVNTMIEPFFRRPELVARLPKVFKEFPEWQMQQVFNDYVVKLKVD